LRDSSKPNPSSGADHSGPRFAHAICRCSVVPVQSDIAGDARPLFCAAFFTSRGNMQEICQSRNRDVPGGSENQPRSPSPTGASSGSNRIFQTGKCGKTAYGSAGSVSMDPALPPGTIETSKRRSCSVVRGTKLLPHVEWNTPGGRRWRASAKRGRQHRGRAWLHPRLTQHRRFPAATIRAVP